MEILVAEHHARDKKYKSPNSFRGLETYIRSTIMDTDSLLLVAESDEKIVGYFIGNIEEAPTYLHEKRIGVVADTCVHPKFRKQKILSQLFEEALPWFKKRGVRTLELSVHIKNKAAIAAWEKFGFVSYRLRMRKTP